MGKSSIQLADRADVAPWLALAEADLKMAVFALSATDAGAELRGLGCFHCQQAAEKWVKGALAALDAGAPRTHDLMVLAASLPAPFDPPAPVLAAFAELSDYGVGPRYPLPGRTTTAEQLASALQAAELVQRWVREVLASTQAQAI